MTPLPSLVSRDRVIGAVLVVGAGVVQAAALAVAGFATRDAFAALHGRLALPWQTIVALVGAGCVAALCLYVSRRQAEAVGQSYAIALRHTLYAKIARLPKSFHEQRRVGALSLRFVGDLSAARLWFGRGLPDVLTAGVVLPGAVAILFALDPRLALAALMPLGLASALMVALVWRLQLRHRHLRQRRASIAIAMIERIAIAPELDLMGRTGKELRALDQQGETLRADAVARQGRTAGMQAILQAGVALAGVAILWVGARNGAAPASVAASLSVMALVALPVQDLGAAWDKYCAWAIAREKACRLLAEPDMSRVSDRRTSAPRVALRGHLDGRPLRFTAAAGTVTSLPAPQATRLARVIAGLDQIDGVQVSFGDRATHPRVAMIGDRHIGLQGSLRRSAALSARKRPKDAQIRHLLAQFDLGDLLDAPKGLDQRVFENGHGLSPAQTLRLDLVRAVLGKAEIIVIASLRWTADPQRDHLLCRLQELSNATILIAHANVRPVQSNTC